MFKVKAGMDGKTMKAGFNKKNMAKIKSKKVVKGAKKVKGKAGFLGMFKKGKK